MGKASKIYKSLTPQQKEFLTEKNISSTFRIKKWISLLTKVSAYDHLGDKMVKRMQNFAIAAFIIAFVSIFVGFISEIGYVFLGTLFLIVLGVVLLIRRSQLKKMDVNNYLRLFFLPVLNMLKSKAGEDAKLAASLDFRNPRKALAPEKSKVGRRDLKLYKPVYIKAKVALLDGALLEFIVGDDVKDFSWTKRSASGKTKYKKRPSLCTSAL